MEMKASVEAKATTSATAKAVAKAVAKTAAVAKALAAAKATSRATVGTERQAWHPQGALLPEAVMTGKLAAQAGPAWAISAQGVTSRVTSQVSALATRRRAMRLLVECNG
jgi:hypothetical protein